MSRTRLIAMALVVVATSGLRGAARAAEAPASVLSSGPTAGDDPYLWLEDVGGQRALDWVERENTRSLKVLESDPRYGALHAQALDLAEANDRIPSPEFLGGEVYNFWQDAEHVRGIWRRTTVADYANAQPNWSTVLDLDALSKAEGANWSTRNKSGGDGREGPAVNPRCRWTEQAQRPPARPRSARGTAWPRG